MSSWARRIQTIARVTAAELLRQPLAWVVLALMVAWLGSSLLWSRLSLAEQGAFWSDFGFGGLWLAAVLLALAMGAPLVAADRQRRTLDLIFSRPVRAWEYVAGKWLALALVLAQAILALALAWCVLLQWQALSLPQANVGPALILREALLAWANGVTVAAIVLALACVATSQLFVFTTTVLVLAAAHLQPLARETLLAGGAPRWQRSFLAIAAAALPDVSVFTLPPAEGMVLDAVCYALLYSALALGLGSLFLRSGGNSDA